MIEYEEGYWGVLFAFRLYGSVLPRAVVWGVACAITSTALHIYLENAHEQTADSWQDDIANDTLKGFTFAMGFLLVMRTQKGYTRWWEGGTLLQQVRGEWFNAVSNLMAFCNSDPEQQQDVEKLQHLLVRLFSLLYGNALMQVSTMRDNCFEFLNLEGFDPEEIEQLNLTHDSCELVLQWIQRVIVEASNSGTIKIAPPILSRVYNQLGNGIVKLNNARKIRDFPVPFSLAQLVTFMLLIHWVTTALVCAATINSTGMAAIVSFTVIAPLWGINYMAVELENPYGDDANDLPLHAMQRDLNRSLKALLHPSTLKPPSYNYSPVLDKEMRMEKVDIQTAWHSAYNRTMRVNHSRRRSSVGNADEDFDLLHGGCENETANEAVYNYGNGLNSGPRAEDQAHESTQCNDTEKASPAVHEMQSTIQHMAALPDFLEGTPCHCSSVQCSHARSTIKGIPALVVSSSERLTVSSGQRLPRAGQHALAPLDLNQLERRESSQQTSDSSKERPLENVQSQQLVQVHDHDSCCGFLPGRRQKVESRAWANSSITPPCGVQTPMSSESRAAI